jgi:hypothetical protein
MFRTLERGWGCMWERETDGGEREREREKQRELFDLDAMTVKLT